VAEPEWASEKDAALAAMGREGFWDDPERFAALGRAEVMDRIEHGLRAAASLLHRLFALAPDEGARIAPGRVARLARDVVQLERAVGAIIDAESQRAVMAIEAAEGSEELVALLEGMYRGWAGEAGAVLRGRADPARPGHLALAVDGLGAFTSLQPEAGLHLLERGGSRQAGRLAAARVLVAPWPDGEPETAALARVVAGTATDVAVARRYQREPTPLVRDRSRGYRTGRLDRVLAGGFDLF
jgi:ATP-dependent Clp protease ATP-binding subunit ClpC